MLHRERPRVSPASRVPDQVDMFEIQMADKRSNVADIALKMVGPIPSPSTLAVASAVQRDDSILSLHGKRKHIPTAGAISKTMKEDKWRFFGFSPLDVVKPQSIVEKVPFCRSLRYHRVGRYFLGNLATTEYRMSTMFASLTLAT